VSPRPPTVAPPGAEQGERSPSAPPITEITSGMSLIAIEAALAELTAWRREAERKIARLEAELADVRSANVTAAAKLDPAPAPVAPMPQFHAPKEPAPPWAPSPFAAVVPVAGASAPVVAAVVEAPAAPVAPAPPIEAPPHVVSIRAASRPQYDLDMRPGESIDLPSGLDGSRRKKVLGWMVVLMILGGMATLIISALASQR